MHRHRPCSYVAIRCLGEITRDLGCLLSHLLFYVNIFSLKGSTPPRDSHFLFFLGETRFPFSMCNNKAAHVTRPSGLQIQHDLSAGTILKSRSTIIKVPTRNGASTTKPPLCPSSRVVSSAPPSTIPSFQENQSEQTHFVPSQPINLSRCLNFHSTTSRSRLSSSSSKCSQSSMRKASQIRRQRSHTPGVASRRRHGALDLPNPARERHSQGRRRASRQSRARGLGRRREDVP